MTNVSVLDLIMLRRGESVATGLQHSHQLVQAADRLGYTRYWVAEHHNSEAIASTSPATTLAYLGQGTERIRLGSGGVMLPNHTPLVVAEQFALLSHMYPGRIDLGLGRAPGTDPVTVAAVRGRPLTEGRLPDAVARYPQDVLEIAGYFGDVRPQADRERFRQVRAAADLPHPPQLWLLGSSNYSAALAGELGLPFAYANHFAFGSNPRQAFAAYRDGFVPSAVCPEPLAMISASVLIADSVDAATRLDLPSRVFRYQLMSGTPRAMLTPDEAQEFADNIVNPQLWFRATGSQYLGSAEQVRDRLHDLVTQTGADELIVTLGGSDLATRMHTLTELAPLAQQPGDR
ncbi:LLM class flavin-dependent oxidoreductase [Gulosibacter bifidus]|uniref:LLM class flavin-dependent oxidoreductase n=1 Tax=Gulosibacter bifidus TaxID=272239 RepID=A0ABW5RIV7_9MICO|nr:LLM class flavin-dependent oxidoreductase [Gulosibacter bifidus]